MLKRYLKRFERLENAPADNVLKNAIKITKRFECLEIGERKISVAITDKVIQQEYEQTSSKDYCFFLCPYCGMENSPDDENCGYCKQHLKTKFAKEYQENTKLLRRCQACGAVNQHDRRNCWVCGIDFSLQKEVSVSGQSENVITLNIDGRTYRSNDKYLPPEIYTLMARIRKEGYKPAIVDEWVKEKNELQEQKNESLGSRLSVVRNSLVWRIALLAITLLFFFFQMRTCFFHP